MPAEARGHARKLPSGNWQLRWYDSERRRRSGGAFPTRSEALRHYRDVIEPELHGVPVRRRDVTLDQLADTFLERHVASDRTIATLRHRLARPLDRFGDVPVSRARADGRRARRIRDDPPGALPLRGDERASADTPGRRRLWLADDVAGDLEEPAARTAGDPRLHGR